MSFFPPISNWTQCNNPVKAGFTTFTDVGGRLVGVPTLNTDGSITMTVSGGWTAAGGPSTYDPGTDGIWGSIPITDYWGRPFSGDAVGEIDARIRFAAAPVVANDIRFFHGLFNDPILSSGTVRGMFSSFEASSALGANPRVCTTTIALGAVTAFTNGALTATGAGNEARFGKGGRGGGAQATITSTLRNSIIDSSGNVLSGGGANAPGADQATSPGTGTMYYTFGCFRTRALNVANVTFTVYWELGYPVPMVY